MQGVNKVILIGNVGMDPEVKTFDNGGKMVKFAMATNESYKKDGEKVTNTEWHRIVTFKKTADVVEQYVKKGDPLYVEGKIQTRSWDDNDGNKKYMTEIVAFTIQMLGSKQASESSQQPEQVDGGQKHMGDADNPGSGAKVVDSPADEEDDLPF